MIMSRLLVACASAFGLLFFVAAPRAEMSGPPASFPQGYLFSAFRAPVGCPEPACESLVVMGGSDGFNWQNIASCYTPPGADIVRDPSITKINGVWWMAHTTSSTYDNWFDIAYSYDGVCYTFLARVSTAGTVGSNINAATWAPQWFVDSDGSVHIEFNGSINTSAAPLSGYEMHIVGALTPGVAPAWSTPIAITGTGIPANLYDIFPFKVGSTYYQFYTNNTGPNHYIELMASSSLTSGYTVIGAGDWAGWGPQWEGACVFPIPGGFEIIFDHDLLKYGMYASTVSGSSLTGAWSPPALMGTAATMQHGTVIPYP